MCFLYWQTLCSPFTLKTGRSLNGVGQRKGDPISRVAASRIPSIVVTYNNYQGNQAAVEHNSTLPCQRTNGPKHNTIATIITEAIPENSTETLTNQSSPKKSWRKIMYTLTIHRAIIYSGYYTKTTERVFSSVFMANVSFHTISVFTTCIHL